MKSDHPDQPDASRFALGTGINQVSMEAVASTGRIGLAIGAAAAAVALVTSVAIGLPLVQVIGATGLVLAVGALTGGFGFAVSWGRSHDVY
jgi:ribose/xylose/arabinose/galactoside ABC-type transport system permease subunit